MLEILSPAGSGEGVIAAVQNGADAVYLGFGDFNARRNAKNFTEEEFRRAAEYCRARGVKIYVTINTLVSDREMASAVEQAKIAGRYGADAIIIQDLGLIQAIRQALPEMPLHGSTQMSIHNLEGVKMAAAMGLSRVVLARELSRSEISYICKNSPIEIEVFAHGALCMCYSGQCYMSSVIGRRSGNRGLCAQPCRLRYETGAHGNDYPLSLKDNCLVRHLSELEDMGVACIKIEGRMRRPEYSAIVTGIYSRAVREKSMPKAEELRQLRAAFSRQGFTDGYFTGHLGKDMFGIRTEEDKDSQSALFSAARKGYLNGEFQRVPVDFIGLVKADTTAKLLAQDDRGNTAAAEGLVPEKAFNRELTAVSLKTQLHKTGGTPFVCRSVKCKVEPGLSLPMSSINEMRRQVLSDIFKKRRDFLPGPEFELEDYPHVQNRTSTPEITVSVLSGRQLSRDMVELRPAVLYIPLEEISGCTDAIDAFMKNGVTRICVTVPRIIHDDERKKAARLLDEARSFGINEALVGNIGHMLFAAQHGFKLRGDFGLNIFNSRSLGVIRELGLISATLSFEMRLEQIRDVSKAIDTEIITYGRLPLMITENCIVKSSLGTCSCDNFTGITDRMGAQFPVVREFGCRNTVLNSQKLFLGDKQRDTDRLGLWATRLSFTTENSRECVAVLKRYMSLGDYEPAGKTRGLYYRGVE